MLVATFGPSSGWLGKTITLENEQFVLEGHGLIPATSVMQYDAQGYLEWSSPGTRAWVGSKAQASAATIAPSAVAPQTPPQTGALIHSSSSPTRPAASDTRTPGQQAASIIGLLLVICGLGAAIYFFALFDTSVPVQPVDLGNGTSIGGGRVNNLGLMSDRQNGIIVGFGMAVVGGVLMVIGRKRSPTSLPSPPGYAVATGVCDACNNPVAVGAAYCPHCGKQLSWAAVSAHDRQ